VCRPIHVKQLRNIGIINSTTRLHLVESFCKIYVTMHGSTNIKLLLNLLFPKQFETPYLKTEKASKEFNPLKAELKPICHLLVLLGAHLIFHISRIRVNINLLVQKAVCCIATDFRMLQRISTVYANASLSRMLISVLEQYKNNCTLYSSPLATLRIVCARPERFAITHAQLLCPAFLIIPSLWHTHNNKLVTIERGKFPHFSYCSHVP
jgi:hypothetical protein